MSSRIPLMSRAWVRLGFLTAGACLLQTSAFAADSHNPIVLELFQSQGCSSCPPANANVNALASRPDILALSFSVTYWDRLGWKDTFARNQFTERQYAYARSLPGGVFTPQVVINGRLEGVGAERAEIEGLLNKSERVAERPAISIENQRVTIGSVESPSAPADVWLVRYDPRTIDVAVSRGENAGKTLPHRNIVRELIRLGEWRGRGVEFALPATPDPAWSTAVLVQTAGAGPILAAAKG
jgi:hypothetical protein